MTIIIAKAVVALMGAPFPPWFFFSFHSVLSGNWPNNRLVYSSRKSWIRHYKVHRIDGFSTDFNSGFIRSQSRGHSCANMEKVDVKFDSSDSNSNKQRQNLTPHLNLQMMVNELSITVINGMHWYILTSSAIPIIFSALCDVFSIGICFSFQTGLWFKWSEEQWQKC